MQIDWYTFKLKSGQPIKEVLEDFDFILSYDRLIIGNSLWGYDNIDELSDSIHTYYCSINSEVSHGLAQIFLSKYSAYPCQKPNQGSVGHVWGDVESLRY